LEKLELIAGPRRRIDDYSARRRKSSAAARTSARSLSQRSF
jgi:hypothetical protein